MAKNKRKYPDALDSDILYYLHHDSRLTLARLVELTGGKVNRASMLKYHIKFLRDNFIKRYTIELDYRKLGYNFPVEFHLKVSDTNKLNEICSWLKKFVHGIRSVYSVMDEYQLRCVVLTTGADMLFEEVIPVIQQTHSIVDFKYYNIRDLYDTNIFIPPMQKEDDEPTKHFTL